MPKNLRLIVPMQRLCSPVKSFSKTPKKQEGEDDYKKLAAAIDDYAQHFQIFEPQYNRSQTM